MTTNERSYIKHFGREANTARKPQLDKIIHDEKIIGQVETMWSPLGQFWIYTGRIFNTEMGESHTLDHDTFEDAYQWVQSRHLEYRRHESFAVYLEYMLSDMSISKTHLAHHLKVSRQTIHDWLNGEYLPDVPNFINLARFYSAWTLVDINTLLVDMSESIV